ITAQFRVHLRGPGEPTALLHPPHGRQHLRMPRALEVRWLHQVQHTLLSSRVRQYSPKHRLLDPDAEAVHHAASGGRSQSSSTSSRIERSLSSSDLNQMI